MYDNEMGIEYGKPAGVPELSRYKYIKNMETAT